MGQATSRSYHAARFVGHTLWLLVIGVSLTWLGAKLLGDSDRAAVLASWVPPLAIVNFATSYLHGRAIFRRVMHERERE